MKTKLPLLFLLLSTHFGWGQTNPTPQTLPYTQNFGAATFTTLPTGMASWAGSGATLSTQATAEASVPNANASLSAATATQTGGGTYGFMTSSNGRLYVQTSSNTSSGANQLALALVTTGFSNIVVEYDVEVINAQPRTVGLVMQYRIGTSGVWTTVTGTGNPFSQAAGTTGVKVRPSITLPTAADNKTVVQLRWATWRGTESGNSSGIAIDNLSVTGTTMPTTPTLSADSTSNTVDNDIDITFTDDATWRGQITAVKIGATTLIQTTDYVISAGNLKLKPSGQNVLLTASGSKSVSVVATGYSDATVIQIINAGIPTTNSTTSINTALTVGTTRTITCIARDQFNNLVSGYTFAYDVTITNNNATTAESYIIDGSPFTATSTSGNPVMTVTNASGVATFTAVLPTTVDSSDGISIQVQLANDTTNVGTAFSFTELLSQTITFNALSAITYGDAALTLSATASSGLPVTYNSSNTAVASISGNNVTFLSNGTVNITASQSGNANFNPASNVVQTLTINKKTLTVDTAAATNKIYNGNNTATITGTLAGIVGADEVTLVGAGTFASVDVASAIAVTSNSTLAGTHAGKYTLTQPTGLSADITQAPQTITFPTITTKILGNADFFATATSATSATNPITYSSSDTSVATVNTSTGLITLVAVGTTTITASQAASLNYTAATDVQRTLIVKPTPLAAWDFFGQSSPTAFNATTFNNLLVSTSGSNSITRGSGATASTGSNSFRTQGFQSNGIATSNTDFFQTTITVKTGFQVSLSSIEANLVGTSTFTVSPGVSNQFAYSLDGTNFTLIGSPVLTIGTPASLTIDLLNITALQNVPYGTTITFRYYASGMTNSGGWGFSSAAAGINGLSYNGTITVKDAVWEAGSWSNTVGPDATLDAILKDAFTIPTNESLTAKNLIINTGGSLTANTNTKLTIANDLTNNLTADKAVFENGASLIQTNGTTNSNTGNITYKRNTSNLVNYDFIYWGSPVANQTLSGMWMTTANDTFYSFNNNVIPQNWAYAAPSTTMEAGKGYLARAFTNTGTPAWSSSNPWTANFIGKPNNGNITFEMINGGGSNIDNLMSNPYPSALDLVNFRTDTDNSAKLTGNFYFWTHATQSTNGNTYSNADYAIFNVAVGGGITTNGATPAPDRYVDACQGFFAETATSGTVTFKNAHRVAGNNNAFYRNEATAVTNDKLWLNLTNTNGVFKQQLLTYADGASNDFDPIFDAKSFDGNQKADFYSVIATHNLAIQSRVLPFSNQDIVPLGYKSNAAGNFNISIDHLQGTFIGKTIYLQDSLLGIDHNLSISPYSFATASGTFNNRFILKYSSALSTNNEDYLNNDVKIFNNENGLNIKSFSKNIDNLVIFDMLGRKSFEQKNINSNSFLIKNINKNSQVLIVKITLENGVQLTKKMINN